MQGLFPFSVVTTPYAPLLCTHNNRGRSANSQCVLSAFSCAFVHNWRLGRGPAPSPSGVRARHGMWFATGANYKAKGVAQISAASVVRAATGKAVLLVVRDTLRFVCVHRRRRRRWGRQPHPRRPDRPRGGRPRRVLGQFGCRSHTGIRLPSH